MAELYIGLMSGTSVDGVDAALVAITASNLKLVESLELAFPPELKQKVLSLFEPGENEIDRAFELDRELGALYATAVNALLNKVKLQPNAITAIGCHGQTIRHRPNGDSPFSVQIGDASTLALTTGIPVIHQFRQADIALGGQGAPLVPAFHKAMFSHTTETRCIINIGGIANITKITPHPPVTGWDTGPGNGLMDAWIQQHKGQSFDHNGEWASSGKVIPKLLERLLNHHYFQKVPPKSTGKEEFTLSWLQQALDELMQLQNHKREFSPADVQRTLLELTATSIAQAVNNTSPRPQKTFLCGGGARNALLVDELRKRLTPCTIHMTDELGMPADDVEAAAFAWLAYCFWHRRSSNLPEVTGASRATTLGQLALP